MIIPLIPLYSTINTTCFLLESNNTQDSWLTIVFVFRHRGDLKLRLWVLSLR